MKNYTKQPSRDIHYDAADFDFARLLLTEQVMNSIWQSRAKAECFARARCLMACRYAEYLTRNNLSPHPYEEAAHTFGYSCRIKLWEARSKYSKT